MIRPLAKTLLAIGFLLTRCATSTTELAEIDRILEDQRREQHLPGLALAIVKDGRVLYTRTLGERDIERNLPVTDDTLFPIGSCTKSFTSMAVAIAHERGVLSLGDHPRKYLPYFRMADAEADARVTLRDMLSHRTGLKAYGDLAAEPAVLSREDYVKAATSAKPVARFGTRFQYSNAMYSAAGLIVGKAYGSTWEGVIENEIFRPLGMTSSTTSTEHALTVADHVTGYVFDSGAQTFRAVPPPRSLRALAPGGNIASSINDMTKWLLMLTGDGTVRGRRYVSEATLRELTTPAIAINPQISYALGWGAYEWNGVRVLEHTGGSLGISAIVSFIPEHRVGFVFLANTSPNFMTRIGNAAQLLYPLVLKMEAAKPAVRIDTRPVPIELSIKATEPVASADAPSVDALLQRMIEGAGGEERLRAHRSVDIRGRKVYENHGVFADLTVQKEAPARLNLVERWTAAEKDIGSVRLYFDGVTGGQETTFGQDAINDAQANMKAKREYAFHQLLDLKSHYKTLTVVGAARVGSEETWVLELTPEQGPPTQLYVSKESALIIRRESGGESETFADYREVDGERVPFHSTTFDALGETTIGVESARFNVTLPKIAFSPNVTP